MSFNAPVLALLVTGYGHFDAQVKNIGFV